MKSLNFMDLDQIQRSSSLMFRLKLLEAATSMQAALGVEDLGRLHCSPIVDNRGVTIMVTVQYVHDQKSVQVRKDFLKHKVNFLVFNLCNIIYQGLTVKWLSISKLFKRQVISASSDKEISAMDLLLLNLLVRTFETFLFTIVACIYFIIYFSRMCSTFMKALTFRWIAACI